jgi:hypothetical protein
MPVFDADYRADRIHIIEIACETRIRNDPGVDVREVLIALLLKHLVRVV